ncbi:MAG: hypothetical protein ACRDJM_01500 [Actinomycetota bacterium]
MGGIQGSRAAYDMMGAAPIRLRAVPRRLRHDPGGDVVRLSGPRGLNDPRVAAVMMGLGAIAAGLLVFAFFWVVELALSIWGSKMTAWPVIFGATVAGGGVALAIAYGVIESRRPEPHVKLGDGTLSIALPEFRRRLIVPRALLRVASIDDTPVRMFHNNQRFPIMGELPEAIFADALDRGPHPWDPGEPIPRIPRDPAIAPHEPAPASASVPPDRGAEVMPWEVSPRPPPAEPSEEEPGWANAGARVPERGVKGYLFNAHGSALPVFTYNPTDIPNLALLFNAPVRIRSGIAARLPWLSRNSRMPFRGTMASHARGLLVKATNTQEARSAFERWGVLREITADDVLDSALRPPKPIKGLRAVAYAAAMLGPLILKIILRNRW